MASFLRTAAVRPADGSRKWRAYATGDQNFQLKFKGTFECSVSQRRPLQFASFSKPGSTLVLRNARIWKVQSGTAILTMGLPQTPLLRIMAKPLRMYVVPLGNKLDLQPNRMPQ